MSHTKTHRRILFLTMTSCFQPILMLLATCLVLSIEVQASSADNTTHNIVSWESGPNTRGTMSLVSSCVVTIFACTATVLHLNVPGYKDSTSQRMWRRIKWTAINILFPEFIFSKAVCDLRQALDELRDFGDTIQHINHLLNWTASHEDYLDCL